MQSPALSRRYLTAMIVLLMLVAIINVADKELLSPVADAVRTELHLSDTQLGSLRSVVFVAAMLGQFLWGPLSDRWVRKYVIALGTVIWSGVTWVTGLAGSYGQLLAARGAMSFAEGCFNPSSYALVTDTFPRQRHGLVLGLMSLTYPVGFAAAVVIASIIGTAHWRQPFAIYGVAGILLGLLVLVVIREPARGASEESVRRAGTYGGHFSWTEFRSVLAVPTVRLGFALDTCQASVNWSLAFWTPTYLTRYHIAPTAEMAALALLPAIVGFVTGALLGGWMIDRLRTRTERAAAWVALASMAGGGLLALLVFNLFQLTAVMVVAFFLGAISYMVLPAVSHIQFSVVPPETKASTIAASNIILNSVIAVLSVLIGVVSDRAGLRLAFGGAVIFMFGCGVLVSLRLLGTLGRDIDRQRALVAERVGTTAISH